MSYDYQVIANSSYGSGVLVSLKDGKRQEKFVNKSNCYYYAQEMIIHGTVGKIEQNLPGLGNLWIYLVENEKSELIATFQKGTWEFVRLLT